MALWEIASKPCTAESLAATSTFWLLSLLLSDLTFQPTFHPANLQHASHQHKSPQPAPRPVCSQPALQLIRLELVSMQPAYLPVLIFP